MILLYFILCTFTSISCSSTSYIIGGFSVELYSDYDNFYNAEITVSELNDKVVIWKTMNNQPFLKLGNATLSRPPIYNGNYQIEEDIQILSDGLVINSFESSNSNYHLTLQCSFLKALKPIGVDFTFEMFTTISDEPTETLNKYSKLRFNSNIQVDSSIIDIIEPRSYLTYECNQTENFFGFGESFSYFNLKGRRVPIVVSEQGVGRGIQPLTDYLNENVSPGVGGDWYTTYAPKPIFLTSLNRSMIFNQSEVFIYFYLYFILKFLILFKFVYYYVLFI
jgi:hypothetical protein